jgi:hypothetical protein
MIVTDACGFNPHKLLLDPLRGSGLAVHSVAAQRRRVVPAYRRLRGERFERLGLAFGVSLNFSIARTRASARLRTRSASFALRLRDGLGERGFRGAMISSEYTNRNVAPYVNITRAGENQLSARQTIQKHTPRSLQKIAER